MAAHYHLFRYLRKKRNKTRIDHLMSAAAVLNPLVAVPQILEIYGNKDSDASLLTWIGFLSFGIIFLAYGIVHRLKSYILLQSLWIVADVFIIVGIIRY
jgi:uncharacterized protein with PQ loop repeat